MPKTPRRGEIAQGSEYRMRGIHARIEVIPPGRDQLPRLGPRPDRTPGQPVELLCVANWWPAKGIHLLIEAFARIETPAVLNLVGAQGAPAYQHRVFTAIDRHEVKDRVRIHGPLSGHELAARYQVAERGGGLPELSGHLGRFAFCHALDLHLGAETAAFQVQRQHHAVGMLNTPRE